MEWFVTTPLFTILSGIVLLAILLIGQPLLFGGVLWVIGKVDKLRLRLTRGAR